MQRIFNRINMTVTKHKDKITHHDVLYALTEELGEYSRAVRVEDNANICQNKRVKEPSKVEIIDLILVAIEAYILRGGTYEEMYCIINNKLNKWEMLWREQENIGLDQTIRESSI